GMIDSKNTQTEKYLNNNSGLGRKTKKRIILGLTVLTLFVAIFATLAMKMYNNNQDSNQDSEKNNNAPSPFKYSFVGFKLPTTSNGRAITFDKIVNLESYKLLPDSAILVNEETDFKTGDKATVSTLQVAIIAKQTSGESSNFAEGIAYLGDTAIKSASSGGTKKLSFNNPDGTKTNYLFSDSTKFTNSNINSDSITADFNLTKTGKDGAEQNPRIGKLIKISTTKADYYVIAWSTNDSWKSQKQKWEHMFSSIKVDQ
ncbi:hypothetical protein KW803_02125, partial [Candidatus Saccharibacteria bacterium]|nr:hypothetical protein [Candidatus Saccharibacteria bacterium]